MIHPQAKPQRVRSNSRLAFAREQGCVLAGDRWICNGNIEASHINPKGHGKTGGKEDDSRAVGMCDFHHQRSAFSYHALGRSRFEEFYSIDLEIEISRLNKEYALIEKKPRERRTLTSTKIKALTIQCGACGNTHPAKVLDIQIGLIVCFCKYKNKEVSAAQRG